MPLTAAAVPLNWLRAPIVLLGPLDREVDYDLAATFSGSFLGLTPQGWLRQWDAEGRVQPAAVRQQNARRARWFSVARISAENRRLRGFAYG